MRLTGSALSLNVTDVEASASFLRDHFGFEPQMAADGFASLRHPDGGSNLIFLRVGLPSLVPERLRSRHADGLIVALVVEDIEREHQRLVEAGLEILSPLTTEDWGERYFQVTDPNGIVVQLVQWVDPPDPAHAAPS